jgi:hypothetical protein
MSYKFYGRMFDEYFLEVRQVRQERFCLQNLCVEYLLNQQLENVFSILKIQKYILFRITVEKL